MTDPGPEFSNHRERFRQKGGDSGNGKDQIRRRLRAVEQQLIRIDTRMENMATKTDIQAIETLISKRESTMLRWLMGILSLGAISLGVALFRTFID